MIGSIETKFRYAVVCGKIPILKMNIMLQSPQRQFNDSTNVKRNQVEFSIKIVSPVNNVRDDGIYVHYSLCDGWIYPLLVNFYFFSSAQLTQKVYCVSSH